MLQVNELITLVLGVAVLIFLMSSRRELKRLPHGRLITGAYLSYVVGWSLTVAEAFFLPELLNLLEHSSYLMGNAFILIWVFKFCSQEGSSCRL